MMSLYHCLQCRELFVADAVPSDRPLLPAEIEDADPVVEAHRDHRTEELRPLSGKSWSRDSYDASVRTIYLLATNGADDFLVIKHRRALAHGYRYELRQGNILELPPVLGLREEDLLRQIVWQKEGEHPTVEEIARFVIIFREAILRLSVTDLVEEVADLHHPLVSYGRPGPAFFKELAEAVAGRIPPSAALWFRDFIERHREGPGPLDIMVRRDFEVVVEEAAPAGSLAARSLSLS